MDDCASYLFLAELAAEDAGRLTGKFAFALLILAGIAKCIQIAKRPTTNSLCVYSLAVFLLSWFVSSVSGALFESELASAILLMASVVLWITSLVLGITGLVTYRSNEELYVQGRKQAWWGVSLSVLALVAVTAVIVTAISERLAESEDPAIAMHEAGDSANQQEFEDLNFRFSPPRKWASIPAQTLNEEAQLAYLRKHPDAYFIVIAEKLGEDSGFGNEGLLAIAKANMEAASTRFQVTDEYPMNVDGIEGICFEADVRINGQDISYLPWVGMHNGFAYQLITFFASKDKIEGKAKAHAVRKGFSIIDREKVAMSQEAVAINEKRSTGFGYEIALPSANSWIEIGQANSDLPVADFYAATLQGKNRMYFAVVPFDHVSETANPKKIFGHLLEHYFSFATSREIQRGAIRSVKNEMECLDKQGTTNISAAPHGFHTRLLEGDEFDYLLAVWWNREFESGESRANELLDRFRTFSPDIFGPDLSDAKKRELGLLLNEIGVMWHNEGKWKESLAFFQAAVRRYEEQTICENVARGYLNTDDSEGAVSYLQGVLKRYPNSLHLQQVYAEALASKGETKQALSAYKKVFSAGYSDEDTLLQFVNLAYDNQEFELSIEVLENFLEQHSSVKAERWRALMHVHNGDPNQAELLLKKVIASNEDDFETIFSLAEVYELAERYGEAIQVAEQLLEEFPDDTSVLELKGRCEFSLKKYPQARATFDALLAVSPTDANAKEYQRYISSMMGKGDRSRITTPLDPVELPKEVRQMMDRAEGYSPDRDKQGYDYIEIYRVTGLSYLSDRQRKTTTHQRVKVLNQTGVDTYSTVSRSFSPLHENLFVNRLVVFDEQGEQVAAGSLEDFFVLDDSEDSEASDERRIYMPIPNLKPGYTLELVYTVEDISPPEDFGYERSYLIGLSPLRLGAVYLVGDLGELSHSASGLEEQSPEDNLLIWSVNYPTEFESEALQADIDEFVPWVEIADSQQTWKQVGDEYLDRIKDKLVLEPEIASLAKRITKNSKSDTEKVVALSRYVQKECTYKAIEFGVRAQTPNKASLVSRNGYGDCKDHSVLLQQLLQSLGIKSHLALVNGSERISPDLPSLDQFSHMIVFVPDFGPTKKDWFFDTTVKNTLPIAPYTGSIQGKKALVLAEGKSGLETIPSYPADAAEVVVQRQVRILENSESEARSFGVAEEITLNRYCAGGFRGFLNQYNSRERKRALRELLVGTERVSISSLECVNLEDPLKSLVLKIDYEVPGALESYGSAADTLRFVGKFPSIWEHYLFDTEEDTNRVTPFRLELPISVRSKTKLTLPSDFKILNIDRLTKKGDSEFVNWQTRISQEGENFLFQSVVKREAGTFLPERYQDYYTTIQRLTKDLRPTMRIENE